jgi:hypothetical protein
VRDAAVDALRTGLEAAHVTDEHALQALAVRVDPRVRPRIAALVQAVPAPVAESGAPPVRTCGSARVRCADHGTAGRATP